RRSTLWIATRNEGRHTTMVGDINQNNRTHPDMFTAEAALNAHPLLLPANYDFASDCESGAWPAGRKSLEANAAGMIGSPSPEVSAPESGQPPYSHDGEKMPQVPR